MIPRTTQNGAPVARFVNVGGAVVELRPLRYMTRWTHRGAPYAADKPYEIGGYNWQCLGCGAYGREGDTYHDPGYPDLIEAREKTQEHAEKCRAIPLEESAEHGEPRRVLPEWLADRLRLGST